MATSLFLALQCVQCSTMQVKPQKKSSNKWVCVVCNQRQSVMRVHARGHRAADLRRFVQEANLSRGRAAHVPVPEEDWVPAVPGEQRDEFPKERKRRMDWSDYLEDPGEYDGGGHHEEARDEDVGIQVTTELPEKRPKVTSLKRAPKAQLGLGGKRPKTPVTSTLPKRQPIEEGSLPCSAAPTAEAQRSKWSNYLDTSFSEGGSGFEDSEQHCSELECSITDVVVDDEVHPDFV